MSLEPELFFGSQRDRIKLKTNKQTADESPSLKCQLYCFEGKISQAKCSTLSATKNYIYSQRLRVWGPFLKDLYPRKSQPE